MSEDRSLTLHETFEWLESHKNSFRDDPVSLKALAHLFFTQPGITIGDTIANIIAQVKTETDNLHLYSKWTTHTLEAFFHRVTTLVLIPRLSLQMKIVGVHYLGDCEKKGAELIGTKVIVKPTRLTRELLQEWGDDAVLALVFSSKSIIDRMRKKSRPKFTTRPDLSGPFSDNAAKETQVTNLRQLELINPFLNLLIQIGMVVKDSDEAIRNPRRRSVFGIAKRPGSTSRIFYLETLEEYREFLGLKSRRQDDADWEFISFDSRDVAQHVEYDRIHKLGIATDRQIKEREAAEVIAALTPLEILDFSSRVLKALTRNELIYVEDVFNLTDDKLQALRGFGKASYDELRNVLINHGYADPNAECIAPLHPKVRDDRTVLRVEITEDELLGRSSDDEDDFFNLIVDDDEEDLSTLGQALKEALEEVVFLKSACDPEE